MIQEKVKILWNNEISPSYYRIGFKCHSQYSDAKPGQFIMLGFPDQINPLLRRPFSIHRLISKDGALKGIEVLYKVVGKCTKKLSMCVKDDIIDIIGPLGNGFITSDNYNNVFIVAGGVGVAPMLFLASYLQKNTDLSKCIVFLGSRSKHDLLCKDDFLRLGMKVLITTEDGSAGRKGLVTDIFETSIKENRPDIIYGCGPTAMLKSLAFISEIHSIPCRVSIETIMACGIGACLGCAVESKKTPEKYLHTCLDGPVFDTRAINFNL
ncbi:MAG: dihydroorotate dehydrogenase electron transfer subunit [Proteobacteria bacterium]|nr:dihydroorotate dehydrogenase electron transfer subunit [Desulfobacteraceae bacterium]MBU3980133.1 dihydroorotate dehydrogenase electron transfer subunit [Pseudomonadota bacterium]MBU4012207.1 dihydroorotate dehydrogenase electron transfer subunit [Pseudomonadota bacterium]MBU4066700.1 dihydroorotate dehydrogenase electron transfer subunit [Pseudomonadota bacterium]MBU4102026.1 dihydroorotate dehydrogenase electron transfer subunit [Pseudomonadota bacterium]